jgi:hypothetical protein
MWRMRSYCKLAQVVHIITIETSAYTWQHFVSGMCGQRGFEPTIQVLAKPVSCSETEGDIAFRLRLTADPIWLLGCMCCFIYKLTGNPLLFSVNIKFNSLSQRALYGAVIVPIIHLALSGGATRWSLTQALAAGPINSYWLFRNLGHQISVCQEVVM